MNKELLKSLRLLEIKLGVPFTHEQAGMDEKTIWKLEAEDYLEKSEDRYLTSEKTKKLIKVVLTGGVFDILHCGHAFFLQKCKEMCDILVVVVASDETVLKIKNRKPVHSAVARASLLGALKSVDLAVVGDPEDKMKVVNRVKPSAIAFGYDQKNSEIEMAKKLGIGVIHIDKFLEGEMYKTSNIIRSLRSS